MTTTLTPATPTVSAPTSSGTRWTSVAEGLWAGTRDGEFLGTVEFVDGGFETSDLRGTRIGRSHSLVAAQKLVDRPAPEAVPVLGWGDERRALAAGWLGFTALAVTAVALAINLFT